MGYEDEQLRSREKPLDLKRIPIKEVLDHLECTRAGLKSDEAQRRLKIFDVNMPEEKQEIKLLKFLGFMWNPLSLVLEIGAIMAIALDESRDWEIFVGILVLLIINATISFIMENNAGNAAASLGARVAPQARILRDGCWIKEDAAILVPGDIICIKQGDIVPADARLLKGGPIKIDQSALTGVSLPVTKVQEDVVYSGTTCKQGDTEAVVIATGVKSFLVKLAGYCDSRENDVGHFQKLWTSIGVLCILWTSLAVIIEMFVMHFQHRADRESVHNLLVLLIGGIPIALPTLLSVTTLSGSRRLSEQGAIIKRMSAIEDMAGMDVLCCDKTGTLTLNKLTVDKNLIKVFSGWRVDDVVRMAARASGIENQDAVDAAILEMLDDPNKARAGIQELHFLPFDPANKMSALTYLDSKGMHRVTKGAPDQILNLCPNNCEVVSQVHAVIEKFAKRGFRSLAVAYQSLPQGRIESEQAPWQFIGVMPLFDPLRGDSAETIRKALNLGVKVKMITGDQLAIAQETGRQLGMGIDMHHSSTLFGENKNKHKLIVDLSDEIIDKADGFAGARPGHKYEIINHLQARKHICGMIGDGVNDAAAFMKADISIAVADSTDAARSASDIVLTEPGLSVIISAVLTGRAISQRMKSYSIYAVSITIRTLLGFMLLALIWKFDFPPFMMLMMAIVNTGTMMVISKDRVRPSHLAVSWTLAEILATGVILGSYLAMTTVIFFWAAYKTNFIEDHFGVASLHKDDTDAMRKLASAVYLQVSTISHALIFVTRSRSWSYVERPRGHGFFITQLIATLIAVYANWSFCAIEGIGWRWAGIIWLYNIVIYLPLDLIKFFIRHVLTTLGLLITQERIEQNQLAEDAKQLAKVARKKKVA